MMKKSHPKICLVIPVFNEGSHILHSLKRIEEEVIKVTLNYEIIVVDDGSTDDTWMKLSEDKGVLPNNLFVIKFSRNFGKEAALVAGLEHANGQAVIIMDADLQHPPSLISEMVNRWKDEDIGIVECVKRERGKENLRYRLGTKLFYWIVRRMTGYDLKGASDYKLLDQKVVHAWKQMPERDTFFRGMTAWLGFKKVQYEFNVSPRVNGEPKWSTPKLIKLALNAVVSFTSLPLRFVSILGFLFFIAAIFLGIHTLYQKFNGNALTGFTTVILLQLIIGSVFMISLGVIGEYISAIYKEVKGRPRYLIENTVVSEVVTYEKEAEDLNAEFVKV
ncbi:glycosyltransferase family 2 protein [Alkalihalobacillus sp. AL-G]|uniref:glycosyltransferase family 2 protein n=1 Tax=Alkalihalobacillus sp. AL-G TaxID=2926399 RepID=UPI00272B5EA3|nr:glycosyltransferase family 2 protein [Alkalihalobacillus sp. AL-G]WLD93927.1 glycosyltransferase family 2 protein [Alkalihalobacillus sp. AL-G]